MHTVVLPNVIECVNMTLVHIHKSVGRKVLCLMLPGTPVIDRSIQLTENQNNTQRKIEALTTVADGIGAGRGSCC